MNGHEDLHSIGLIGIGGIGTALLTHLIQENGKLGIKNIFLHYREKNKERIQGIERQHAPSTQEKGIDLCLTPSLNDIGKYSDIVVITVGDSEKEKKILRREDLIGHYFKDIADIMHGLGDNPFKLFMATNPITTNCAIADICSQQKDPLIVGFTRSDFERANYILSEWIKEDDIKDLTNEKIKSNVLGPHGYGLVVTNIKIGYKNIYNNKQLRALGFKESRSLEKLSQETAEYGEMVKRHLREYSTPDFFANKIVESLKAILRDGKDTAAIKVNLSSICESSLSSRIVGPTYSSFPIKYERGIPKIDSRIDFSKIPDEYKESLLRIMIKEEKAIQKYLKENPGISTKLQNHFRPN